MNFELKTETPSEAILRLALAKEENEEKFGGRCWRKQRADGRYAILVSFIDGTSIKAAGKAVPTEKLTDTNLELRITEEDLEALDEALMDMSTRVAEIKVNVVGELALKTLTLKDGTTTRNIYMWGSVEGVREGSSTLSSDEFENEDDVFEFLEENRQANRAGREAYRAAMQMASESNANAKESENILA